MREKASGDRNNQIDGIQSEQYKFPYHYIPSRNSFPMFSKNWRFAPSYLAALKLVEDWLVELISPNEIHWHMDYGCGDGGFVNALREVDNLAGVQFNGVDFDSRAIAWARVFSKEDEVFQCLDVCDLPAETFDSGSLIEVFEHIPPSEGAHFVAGLAKSLKKGAELFVTVPSSQKPVEEKHYRHFDFALLEECFASDFDVIDKFGFERQTLLSKLLSKILMNRYIVVETPVTSRYLTSEFERKSNILKGCGRIGMVLRKR